MVQDELLSDIQAVLASAAGVDPADVTPEKSFDDLGVDSMTLLEAVVATVGELVDHLARAGVGAPT